MRNKTEIKVFIASPSDTAEERDLIEKYIARWNSNWGDDEERNIVLKPIRWENNLGTRSNTKAQNAIDEDLLEKSDILIGVFWTKFGSPTDKANSGTEGEILYFLENKKPVIMYFLDKPIPPSKVNSKEIEKIKEFKQRFQNDNIYKTITLESKEDFFDTLMKDLNRNIKVLTEFENVSEQKKKEEKSNKWYTESIKNLIEKKLSELGLQLPYRRIISFDENVKLWNSLVDVRHREIIRKIFQAREEAFNIKYGNYDYSLDLRENYKNEWYKIVEELLIKEKIYDRTKISVLGVASNNGIELVEIFNKHQEVELSVIDLSAEAIKKGKTLYPNISFHQDNMEETTLEKETFDVYLNLRSIHSSGVDIRMTLAECFRLLKPNGVAIISVSNGYLTPNPLRQTEFVETLGMYDNRIGTFTTDKPYDLANKIRMKLDNYGFKGVEVHTGPTEIFIKATK